jgi:hypothetical protein
MSSSKPRTRAELNGLKKQGSIVGYFGKLPRGCPPKNKKPKEVDGKSEDSLVSREDKRQSNTFKKPPAKKPRGTYVNWSAPCNFDAIKAAVAGTESTQWIDTEDAVIPVPRSTVYSVKKRLSTAQKKDKWSSMDDVMLLAVPEKGLTTFKQREWLADVIRFRDKNNNGMTRKEVIQVLEELADANGPKAAENHLDYLIRMKILPKVTNDGRVVRAQKTTTKRSQITIEQQLRWHSTVASVWAEQDRLNQPADQYKKIRSFFIFN